ncbi:MAG: autotransporter domain-containing protein [Parvibaculum sp.]
MSVSVVRAKQLNVMREAARPAAEDFRFLTLSVAPRRHRRPASFLTALLLGTTALVAVPAHTAHAQSVWDGSASGDWDTNANWDTNAVPTGADDVTIDDVTVNAPVIGTGVNASTDSLYIGDAGTGSLTVTGTGELNVGGDFYVGNDGTGALTVQTGGSLIAGHATFGGNLGGDGEGSVTGAGSSWLGTGMSVGYEGTGSFTVSDGGAVTAEVWIGDNTGSGTVLVTGTGSSWVSGGEFTVGGVGTGDLTVADGATVNSVDSTLGLGLGSSGTALVTGAGSSWTSTNGFFIGQDGEGAVTVADGGLLDSTGANIRLGLNGSGTGALTVTGAGSSIVSTSVYVGLNGTGVLNLEENATANTGSLFIGALAGSDGTVTIADDGTVWNMNALSIGFDGAGTLTLADGAVANVGGMGGTVDVAANAGSVGTLNIGDGGAAGTLYASDVVFGAGTGTLNFDHTETNYLFYISILGNGSINHLGGVTRLTGTNTGFMGVTTVSGGTLKVNSDLGGTVDVLSGGTLGGFGSVGNTSVASGAAVAPGASIGTLTVAGDVAFDAGSFFDVEVDAAGNEDLLDVTGTATIAGGTVRVAPLAGSYAASTVYTILTANTVTGIFDAVTSSFAFLTPSLTYDAQNVFLTLDLTAAFQDVALTPNQFNAAGAADALGGGNPVYDEILTMTEEEAQAAFDALSGEAHASARTSFFLSAQQIRGALLARLRVLSGGAGTQTAGVAPLPAAGDAVPGGGSVLWGQLIGSIGQTDGNGNAAELDRSSAGFIGGIDKAVGEASRIGVALGYSRADFDVDARASSGDSDNIHAAAYAGTKLGRVDLSGILAYSFQQADTARTVIVGGLTNDLTADYEVHTVQAAVEAATDIAQGSVVLTPFAGLAVIQVETDGFTEQGGPAALTVASASDTIGVSTVGLRARRESETVALTGSLGWRHAFGDTDPSSRAAFASAPATPFTVEGAPISENALALEAGIETQLGDGLSLGLAYAGEYGSDARDHGLKVELRFAF